MSLRDRTLAGAAPALLLVIALIQAYAAHVGFLSPWKGGGFGMFSTVDSPAARFLRVRLHAGSEQISVLVPGPLQALAQKARTAPSAHRLDELARELVAKTWVKVELTPAVRRYYDLLPVHSNSAEGHLVLMEARRAFRDLTDTLTFDEPLLVAVLDDDLPRARPRHEIAFDQVVVQVWRYRVERTNWADRWIRLSADQIAETTVAALQQDN